MYTVERLEGPEAPRPARWLGAGGNEGPSYVLKRGEDALWSVGMETDPPGGWVEVTLDIWTGIALSRGSPSPSSDEGPGGLG
jgi:hypothetical protein